MKTEAEILAYIETVKESDWMGTITGDLIDYLSYDAAKPFLKDGVAPDGWGDHRKNVKPPIEAIKNYLEFAWEKANDCRGLSAARSLDHISTWLWLAGYDSLVDREFDHYEHYGKRQLVIASIISEFDWESHDNGQWVNDENEPSLPEEEIRAIVNDAKKVALEAMATRDLVAVV